MEQNQEPQEPKKPSHELVQLEPMDMHGPIEITAAVYVRLPDGRVGTLNFHQLVGYIPTRADIKAQMDALLTPEGMAESHIPAGTRMLDKPEFVAHYTAKETGGTSLPMPGDQFFIPCAPEIPKAMLVHAIMGACLPVEIGNEYAERGLTYFISWENRFKWNEVKLAEQPEDILLAIYERVTT